MLELRFIRENTDALRQNLKKRGNPALLERLDELLVADKDYRTALSQVEAVRQRRNTISKEINDAKKAGKDAAALFKEAKELPDQVAKADTLSQEKLLQTNRLLSGIPNVLHESVPYGKDDTQNETVRDWGGQTVPDFGIQSHVDLIERLGIADIERAAKTSGARFYFLKNELVLLDLALQRFALDNLYKKGFQTVYPPFMMRRGPYEGVTDLKDFEDVMYKIEGEDLYLIATSEHPMAAMHMDEVFAEEDLPLKYAGLSACFRKEAGAHGKDTKGIFRVHQFSKVEQFVFCKPEDSWRIHEELLANAEEIYQKLEIHFRVVNICTGDIGTVAAKKYDIEAWMPAQKTYREVVSCSNCTSYQAVGLNVKYGKYGGAKEYVHTLNSTAIANPRALVAILENFQQPDGTVKIPKALHSYLPFKEIVAKKKKTSTAADKKTDVAPTLPHPKKPVVKK
ncbi:serine--tRNA ligase [Candidatus Micrarchaeota archaeon]|nr:serine--tRNA ligase [Candidatus Micrarchaeota archaeon]